MKICDLTQFYSPLSGGVKRYVHEKSAYIDKYAPDLLEDPFYRWLTTYHWVPLTVLGLALLAIGGWPLVNWAIFLRVVVGLRHSY